MNVSRWDRIEQLFAAALDHPKAERALFIERECADDVGLRDELQSLLAAGERNDHDGFLTPPAPFRKALEAVPPRRLGDYEICGELGCGGMGYVFRARRSTTQERVALKVLRNDFVTPQAAHRFDHEVRILRRLDHPGIARILDAGLDESTDPPRPYFAMELIEGHSLREFVDQHQLDQRARVALFLPVCDAIEHAHQQAILHRDLKPSNLMVAHDGQTKVLDFGVGRTLDTESDAWTSLTGSGELLGTPRYMSPEQAGGQAADIDRRSDLYSLAVILYELIAGHLPHELDGKPVPEQLRVIREDEPERLGRRDRTLRDDLEIILSKALEPDRRRRYRSVAEFAADLRRYLDAQPIVARPRSSWYQLRQFSRRHRPLVAATLTVLIAALTALILVNQQRLRAEASLAEAQAALALFEDLLRAPDPRFGPGRGITMADALLHNLPPVLEQLQDQPLVAARFEFMAGRSLLELGEIDEAEPLLRSASATFERELGPHHEPTLQAQNGLGRTLMYLGRDREAIELQGRVVAAFRGRRTREALVVRANFATMLTKVGDLDDAERVLLSSLEIAGELPESGDIEGVLECELGWVCARTNRFEEAGDHYARAHTTLLDRCGPTDGRTLAARYGQALVHHWSGRREIAESIHREVWTVRRDTLGPQHPDTLESAVAVGSGLSEQGAHKEGAAVLISALEALDATLGEQHYQTLACLGRLGDALLGDDRPEQARPYVQRAIDGYSHNNGASHLSTLDARNQLAAIDRALGNLESAEEQLRVVVTQQREQAPDSSFAHSSARQLTDLLQQSLPAKRAKAAGDQPLRDRLLAIDQVATTLLELGQAEEAANLLDEALAEADLELDLDDPLFAQLQWHLGIALIATGDNESGQAWQEESGWSDTECDLLMDLATGTPDDNLRLPFLVSPGR